MPALLLFVAVPLAVGLAYLALAVRRRRRDRLEHRTILMGRLEHLRAEGEFTRAA